MHWVGNLYAHKTKDCDTTQVKRKHGRPPKQKIEQNEIQKPAANTCTTQPRQANKNSKNEIISRDIIDKVNEENEKSDRLTVARLDSIVKGNKQNYKSNLMTEKYSLFPVQSYPLTPAQTALQHLSEKHPDFEIQPVNTIRPPEVEYKCPRYSYQLIHYYPSSESIYHNNLTLIKLSKA